MDEDEDAEEKRRRMEAKIAAENFGAVIGFAAGAALAVKENWMSRLCKKTAANHGRVLKWQASKIR